MLKRTNKLASLLAIAVFSLSGALPLAVHAQDAAVEETTVVAEEVLLKKDPGRSCHGGIC